MLCYQEQNCSNSFLWSLQNFWKVLCIAYEIIMYASLYEWSDDCHSILTVLPLDYSSWLLMLVANNYAVVASYQVE